MQKYRIRYCLNQIGICSQFSLHIRKLSVSWVAMVCCVGNFNASINTLLVNLKVRGATQGKGYLGLSFTPRPQLPTISSCDGVSHGAAGDDSNTKRRRNRYMHTFTHKKNKYIDTQTQRHMHAHTHMHNVCLLVCMYIHTSKHTCTPKLSNKHSERPRLRNNRHRLEIAISI